MDKILTRPVTTKWGSKLQMHYREGRSDWNTVLAILQQDEYLFHKLPFVRGVGIDLGAHIGTATIAMASLGMQVISVEILPENIEMIQKNLDINGLKSRIYHRAVGGNDTDILHLEYTNPSTETGFVHEFIGQAKVDALGPGIQTISLDTIFAENQINRCNILKTDCEGGEWPAFEKVSSDTLRKIDWIVGEIHGRTRDEFVKLLGGIFEDVTSTYMSPGAAGMFHVILRRI